MFMVWFGEIAIKYDGERYWLIQNNGEGMEFAEDDMEDLLQQFHAANF